MVPSLSGAQELVGEAGARLVLRAHPLRHRGLGRKAAEAVRAVERAFAGTLDNRQVRVRRVVAVDVAGRFQT